MIVAQVLLAAPTVETVRLTEALRRLLMRRGHRVRTVIADPVTARCARTQLCEATLLPAGRRLRLAGLDSLVVRDLRLDGVSSSRGWPRRRALRRLERLASSMQRLLDEDLPELVVITGARDGAARLLARLVRESGCPLLHLGPGLLPGTLQWDGEGLDGDSSTCRRTAAFYRGQKRDPEFLKSALVHAVATRVDGSQRRLIGPSIEDLLATQLHVLRHGGGGRAAGTLSTWRRLAAGDEPAEPDPLLPDRPFVAILQQRSNDPRTVLDSPYRLDQGRALRHATERAIEAIDPGLGLVEVSPRRIQPGPDALQAALTAAAVITVNDRAATAALLAGTPVLHVGRAPWSVRGVTERIAEPGDLVEALGRALHREVTTLRERMLTHLLTVDHVWCDPIEPEASGLSRIVGEIERLCDRTKPVLPPLDEYRPGPHDPLSPRRS